MADPTRQGTWRETADAVVEGSAWLDPVSPDEPEDPEEDFQATSHEVWASTIDRVDPKA